MPRTVFNTKTKQILVVWEKHPGNHPGHSLWGRLLNPSGKPSGSEFVIVDGPNTYGPSLTYNVQQNEYLLVYANEFPNHSFSLFAQRLNARGIRAGTPVRISPENEAGIGVNNDRPLVTWNARTGNYNIFWQKDFNSNSTATVMEGLYGAVLSKTLSVIKNQTLIVKAKPDGQFTIHPFAADAAFHPVTGRLLLGYFEYAPGFGTSMGPPAVIYFVASIDPELNAIQPSNFVKIKQGTSISNGDLRFGFFPDGSGLVVFSDSTSLKLRKIDMTGKLTGPLKPAFRPPLNNSKLSFISVAQSNGVAGFKSLILGVKDPENIAGQRGLWTQLLDSAGIPSGSPELIETLSDFVGESTLAARSNLPTTRNYRFVAVYQQGRQTNVPPTASESTGLILLNLNFTFP